MKSARLIVGAMKLQKMTQNLRNYLDHITNMLVLTRQVIY